MDNRYFWKNNWVLQNSKSGNSVQRKLFSVSKHQNDEVDTKKDSQEVRNCEPVKIP